MTAPFRFLPELQLKENTKLGKFTLHKSTTIIIDLPYLMNDPTVWKYPDLFDPDRFESQMPNEKKRHMLSYVPFFAGPRACPA